MKKKSDSQNFLLAFREAECFLTVSKMTKEKTYLKSLDEKEIYRSINFKYATHVNHAYAFELYLKCLMIIENGQYFEVHELSGLFKLLSTNTQKNIERRYSSDDTYIRRNTTYFGFFESPTLYELLEEANRAFIDFRYLFSRSNTPTYELDNLIECVRQELFVLKPELIDEW